MLARPSSGERGSQPPGGLAARRRLRRRRSLAAFGIFLLLASLVVLVGLRQEGVRISRVQAPNPEIESIARKALDGNYAGIIPRNSVFFFSASRIRANIMTARPDIAAVSISRSGLTSLSVSTTNRVPVARWCGTAPSGSSEVCYLFDANGYIYEIAATTTQTINNFFIYAPLDAEDDMRAVSQTGPVGFAIAQADRLPGTFDFARRLGTLGSPVSYVQIRGDEVDDILASGTRVTYLFGNELNAYAALVSASAGLNLADGSLEYVDLRFDGKVYLKRKQ